MVVVLPVFWSMGQLAAWWSPPLDAVVLAVVLAVSLPPALAAVATPDLPVAAGALLTGAAAAVGCATLLDHQPWGTAIGAVLFALTAAVPVWLRRFGPGWRTGGTVAGLPLLAVLVHPLPDRASVGFFGWMMVATGIAYAWAAAVHILAGPGSTPAPPATTVRAGPRGPTASTRMAIQLALAVGAAFAVGHWIDPGHLVWPVLTVLVVHSANRGRGDVLCKGIGRGLGALAGTLVATWLSGTLPARDDEAIVAIFAILLLAAALRGISHAGRAACTTAALAFLYGYFGQGGAGLLAHRLVGVAAGAVLGIAAAWFVLPVRTTDIARLRIAALLAAAADVAASTTAGTPDRAALDRLAAADRDLAVLTPTLRAARRFGRGPARHLDRYTAQARSLARQVATIAPQPSALQPSAPEPAVAATPGPGIADLARQIAAARRHLRARPADHADETDRCS